MEFLHRDRVREKGITPALEESIFHAMGRFIQIAAMMLDMCMVWGKCSPEWTFIHNYPQFSTELGELSTVLGQFKGFLALI